MPFSNGIFSLIPSYRAIAGQTIRTEQHNPPLEDIANGLSQVLLRDGSAGMVGDLPMGGRRITNLGTASLPADGISLGQVQELLSQLALVHPGTLQVYTISSATPPVGYVFANGQALSRATYATLWAAVSGGNNLAATEEAKTAGQYGPGNGSTTFTVPNLYADGGYFIRPISSGRGIGTVQADQFKEHTHDATSASAGAHAHDIRGSNPTGGSVYNGIGASIFSTSVFTGTTQPAGAHTHPITVTETGGAETRPKNVGYPVIIKT